MSSKTKSRRTVILYHKGTRYEVPSNHVRRFRSLIAAPKIQKHSLVRNQWSAKAYRYE
jgi:hypothetical protein